MGDFRTEQGGYICLDERALGSLSAAATLFSAGITAALAAKTIKGQTVAKVVVTFRTAGVTMTANGTTPTAGANGIDYTTGTFEFWGNAQTLSAMKAIQNAGTTTGYYQVWLTA